ncbi:MAG: HAD family hydrolase [Colwellia sp.]
MIKFLREKQKVIDGLLFSVLLLTALTISKAVNASDPLPSWNEGENKAAIIAFVKRVTDKDSTSFVNPSERIATFDNDGTLWAEQPIYAQLMFAIERIYTLAPNNPQWKTQQPFAKLLSGDIEGALSHDKNAVNTIVMAANTGMDDEQYTQIVEQWITQAKHPVTQRLYTKMVYQPMLELITYLQDNDFKTYIVSGGGIQFIRAWSEQVYNIPPEQVIGSTMKRSFVIDPQMPESSNKVILRHAEMDFYNNKANKVIAINTHIGRRPIAAFGNSDGDMQMLKYVTDGKGERLGVIIHHTDEKREWAYDRKSPIGHLSKALDDAKSNQWQVIDMKKSWTVIYPH